MRSETEGPGAKPRADTDKQLDSQSRDETANLQLQDRN